VQLTLRQRASWLAHLFKAATQQHHVELKPLFAPFIPDDAVVLDVGAHAGQFAKLFARMARHGHVYAFEPSAYARSILQPALAFNRIANVSVIPAGLSDVASEAVLHTPLKRSSSMGFGTAHLGAHEAGAAADQTVSLCRLDDFAGRESLARLDFVKADIEGWEMRALVGGEQTLMRFRPTLFLEVDGALMPRAGDTPDALFAWLAERGWQAFRSPSGVAAPAWSGAGDYLFAPSERA
jgi:FkbM family methyltransferase